MGHQVLLLVTGKPIQRQPETSPIICAPVVLNTAPELTLPSNRGATTPAGPIGLASSGHRTVLAAD